MNPQNFVKIVIWSTRWITSTHIRLKTGLANIHFIVRVRQLLALSQASIFSESLQLCYLYLDWEISTAGSISLWQAWLSIYSFLSGCWSPVSLKFYTPVCLLMARVLWAGFQLGALTCKSLCRRGSECWQVLCSLCFRELRCSWAQYTLDTFRMTHFPLSHFAPYFWHWVFSFIGIYLSHHCFCCKEGTELKLSKFYMRFVSKTALNFKINLRTFNRQPKSKVASYFQIGKRAKV